MKILFQPFIVLIILYSYAAINFQEIFGASYKIVEYFTYGIRAIVTIISLIFILFLIVNKRLNDTISKFFLVISLYLFLIIYSSLITGNLTVDILLKNFFAFGLYVYTILGCFNLQKFLKSIYVFFLSILIFNLIFYFFVPDIGVYTIDENGVPLIKGILTNRNSVIYYTIPLIVLSYLIKKKMNQPFMFIVNIIAVITAFLTGSVTAIVSITVLVLLLLLHKNFKLRITAYLAITFTASIILVLINTKSDILSYIIVDLLGSDKSMSGRDLIWDKTLDSITLQYLFLGWGIGSNTIAEAMNYATATNGNPINDPFNGLLNLLFFNGIIGLIFFLSILLIIAKKLNYLQNKLKDVRYVIILYLTFIVVSYSESVFVFTNFTFWIFIIIGWMFYFKYKIQFLQ